MIPTTAKTGAGIDVLLQWLTHYSLAPAETVDAETVARGVENRVKKHPHPPPPVLPASGKGPFAEYARAALQKN